MITKREIATFECGIKLGGLFHQFVGTPVSRNSKKSLQRAMEEALLNQPHVKEAEIEIPAHFLKGLKNPYNYISLEGKMINARVIVEYEGVKVKGMLKYDSEIDYPKMSLEEILER